MREKTIVEVRNVTKRFPGVVALNNVSFDLREGEIHALVGENGSGKSTFIKILSGVYQPDDGSIFMDGQPVRFANPVEAQEAGIATIHQELNLIPSFDIASNIFLNREPVRFRLIDFRVMYERAAEVLRELGVDLSPRGVVAGLGVAEKQLVEIARAMSQNMRVLLLDEPTAALPHKDVERLFEILERLKERGVGIIYVSHRLEEIERIADRVTVFRDGQRVETRAMSEVSLDEVVRLMVGREVERVERTGRVAGQDAVLLVEGLTCKGSFADVTFSLRRGEIVGIAGLVGSGRSEVVACLAGALPLTSGRVVVNGSEVSVSSPRMALDKGVGFVPADRKAEGLALLLPVVDNITMSAVESMAGPGGFVNPKRLSQKAKEFVSRLAIRVSHLGQKVQNLSGGNQQKVVLAKTLAAGSRVLLMDEPTRGVDVATRREIYVLLDRLSQAGCSILISSSDLDELLTVCDRVLAMYRGRVVGEYPRGTPKSEVLGAVFGQTERARSAAGAAASDSARDSTERSRWPRGPGRARTLLGVPLLTAALVAYFAVVAPGFATGDNLASLSRQLSILLLTTCAQAFALVTGGIDLSIGAVMALVSMVAGLITVASGHLAVGLLSALAVGTMVGAFNGFVVGKWNVEPFIVTLGAMYAARGAALLLKNGEPVFGFPERFALVGDGWVGPVPSPVVVALVFGLVWHVVLTKTRLGRHMLAVGASEEAAKVCGVNVFQCKFMAYLMSALFASVAGIVLASRLFSGQPTLGSGAHVEAMAAAIIGGVSVEGGRANLLGICSGVLVVGLLSNGLNIMNVPPYPQLVIMGGVLIGSLLIDRLRHRAEVAR